MTLITFEVACNLSFRKSAGGATITVEANRPYVFSNSQAEKSVRDDKIKTKIRQITRMDMRIRNFNLSSAVRGQKVLIYNGSGGYGDQIMTWPLARILANRGLEVHIAVDPGNQTCWWNFSWVKSINVIPMQAALFEMFDHHIVYDMVANQDTHSDQAHPLDMLLHKIGIEPDHVPVEEKTVRPQFTPAESGLMRQLKRPYIFFQPAATNPVRTLPPSEASFLLGELATALPGYTIYVLMDEFNPPAYREAIATRRKTGKVDGQGREGTEEVPHWPNVKLLIQHGIREVWAATAGASLVVAPDSMMVHVAGSLGVPCIGLWGPTDPSRRVRYYENHHAIHHAQACPHAPCFHYLSAFPKYCPPRAQRNICEVLAAISPNDVIELARSIVPDVPAPAPEPLDIPFQVETKTAVVKESGTNDPVD